MLERLIFFKESAGMEGMDIFSMRIVCLGHPPLYWEKEQRMLIGFAGVFFPFVLFYFFNLYFFQIKDLTV